MLTLVPMKVLGDPGGPETFVRPWSVGEFAFRKGWMQFPREWVGCTKAGFREREKEVWLPQLSPAS